MQSFDLLDQLVCPVCHVGRMSPRLTTYIRQFGETIINVPNTPALECDVCHAREFDPEAVQRIEMLVGQAGPPPNHFRPTDLNRAAENTASKKTAKEPTAAVKKNSKPKTAPHSDEVSGGKPRGKAKA